MRISDWSADVCSSDLSGLPDAAQVTTARDLAMLGRALVADFPDRYGLFSKTYVVFGDGSQPTLNGWLSAYRGAEGIKTGFTCGPGYTLLAPARRQGRRLIGGVLGARPGGKRQTGRASWRDKGWVNV